VAAAPPARRRPLVQLVSNQPFVQREITRCGESACMEVSVLKIALTVAIAGFAAAYAAVFGDR
jgi:hypothetical protein